MRSYARGMANNKTLIDDIETFLASTGMGACYFGQVAARNSELVKRLRDGGRVWPETEMKIRVYMQANADKTSATAGDR